MEVRDSKKNLFSVFCKFFFVGAEVDLTLKYKCLELIRAAPTKEIWFLDSFAPFFGYRLACLANTISSTCRSNPEVSGSGFWGMMHSGLVWFLKPSKIGSVLSGAVPLMVLSISSCKSDC